MEVMYSFNLLNLQTEAYSVGAAASLRLSGRSEMKGSDGVTVSTWIKTTRPSVNVRRGK